MAFILTVLLLAACLAAADLIPNNQTLFNVPLSFNANSIQFMVTPVSGTCGNVDLVFIVANQGIAAYNASGVLQYTINFPMSIQMAPLPVVVAKTTVVQLIAGLGVYGYDCLSGTFLWSHTDTGVQSNAAYLPAQDAICYGTKFFGQPKGSINCLSGQSGKLLWYTSPCDSCTAISTLVAAGNGLVYFEVTGNSGNVVGIDSKGNKRFSTPGNCSAYVLQGVFSASANAVVFATGQVPEGNSPSMNAYDYRTGATLWQSPSAISQLAISQGVIIGSYLVYGDYTAISAASGARMWQNNSCQSSQCPPPDARCGVSVISVTGSDIAQVGADGTILSRTTTWTPVIYVAAGQSVVYAVMEKGYNTPASLVAVAAAWQGRKCSD